VGGDSLGGLGHTALAAEQFGYGAAAAEDRGDEPSLARGGECGVHVPANSGIARKIVLDVLLRLGEGDAEITRQALWPHPIENTEVDDLGRSAHLRVHRPRQHAENLGGRSRMNVLPLAERLAQYRVVR